MKALLRPAQLISVFLSLAFMATGLSRCATEPPSSNSQSNLPTRPPLGSAKRIAPLARNDTSPKPWKKLWSKTLTSYISDLNLSADGKTLLVSTLPDRENNRGPQHPQISMLDQYGKTLWTFPLKTATRTQAISRDGKLAIVSSYDDEMLALNHEGKVLWKKPGMCKPFFLNNKILCFHDEDNQTRSAFELLDTKGQMLGPPKTLPPGTETLSMKVSHDENHFVVRLTQGLLQLYRSDGFFLWQKTVEGEIIDLGISSGPKPQVAVLYGSSLKQIAKSRNHLATPSPIHLTLYNFEGLRLLDTIVQTRMEQLEFSPDASGLLLYGNGNEGQYLVFYDAPTGGVPTEKWNQLSEQDMDYSSFMQSGATLLAMAFNDRGAKDRHSHAFIFNYSGELLWNILLNSPEKAFLYIYDFNEANLRLATAMDDGTIQFFQLKN